MFSNIYKLPMNFRTFYLHPIRLWIAHAFLFLCSATTSQAITPTAPMPTGVVADVYMALGNGPIRWLKVACPLTSANFTQCNMLVLIEKSNECLHFIWNSKEVVPWNWPYPLNPLKPDSARNDVMEPVLSEVFVADLISKNQQYSLSKIMIVRPNKDATQSRPNILSYFRIESLMSEENALPKLQYLLSTKDVDLLHFSNETDRQCIGNKSFTYTP